LRKLAIHALAPGHCIGNENQLSSNRAEADRWQGNAGVMGSRLARRMLIMSHAKSLTISPLMLSKAKRVRLSCCRRLSRHFQELPSRALMYLSVSGWPAET
jgi:hypothetical protein